MTALVLQQPMFRRLLPAFLIATLLLPGLPMAVLCAEPAGKGTYADLVTLFKEFQAWQASGASGVTTDYSAAAIEKRKAQLGALQARLADMGVASWQKAEQVDYLIVRAELDKEHFIQQVTRPWARDPVFYVAELQEVPFAEVPASGENLKALQQRLRAIPGYLGQARSNLTDVAADYADLAISLLERSDGVEAGYPYRPVPPPGVVGWYDDLLQRADKQRSLAPDIERAKAAIVEFQSWLKAGRPQMNARAGVGEERLDWFLKNALLLPYDSAQVEVLGERELERMWAFYALERHRNRGLPELQRAKDRFEYGLRLAQTDKLVRNWLVEQQWISIPDYIPVDLEVMGYNVPFIERETAPNFWEQVQYRDPVPDHLHADPAANEDRGGGGEPDEPPLPAVPAPLTCTRQVDYGGVGRGRGQRGRQSRVQALLHVGWHGSRLGPQRPQVVAHSGLGGHQRRICLGPGGVGGHQVAHVVGLGGAVERPADEVGEPVEVGIREGRHAPASFRDVAGLIGDGTFGSADGFRRWPSSSASRARPRAHLLLMVPSATPRITAASATA